MEKPVIIDLAAQSVEEFALKHGVIRVIDTFKEQLEDLFLIRNPQYRFNKNYQEDFNKFLNKYSQGGSFQNSGNWVYFPWNKTLVHYFDDKEHQEVRTARNKNLITGVEQERFAKFKIGIAGLSVGSHGAITTALMGGGRMMKLADPDVISPSNLNRMRFDFTQIGVNKAELIAQYIHQLDPYSDIHIYPKGITEDNLEEFLDGLDILIEELDDIELKIKMREEAKKKRIPVVMATDNGDNVIIDIERFDLNPHSPIFYGKMEGFDIKEVKKSPQKMFEAMARIIDVSLVPPRVFDSINEVGKTIYSWPQVATAATLSGAVLAYVIKRISLGENIKEGKLEVNLDSILDPDYEKKRDFRAEKGRNFLGSIGL